MVEVVDSWGVVVDSELFCEEDSEVDWLVV